EEIGIRTFHIAIKCAELALIDADIGVIDIAVNNECDNTFRVEIFPGIVSTLSKLEKFGIL
ncbi:MAG: hypothetical protein M0Z70_05260, partial [Nitrospiraceae bacterium]|nr:hypothetical protein [Nitrospiraceae bacterium]